MKHDTLIDMVVVGSCWCAAGLGLLFSEYEHQLFVELAFGTAFVIAYRRLMVWAVSEPRDKSTPGCGPGVKPRRKRPW